MDSTRYHNAFPLLHFFIVASKCGHYKLIACVSCDRFTELFAFKSRFLFGVSLQFVKVPLQISVGVWIAVSEVDRVIVIVGLHAEGKGVVVTHCLLLHGVLVVAHVSAGAHPALPVLLGFDL